MARFYLVIQNKIHLRYAHLESRQVTSKARDVMNRLNQMSLENA